MFGPRSRTAAPDLRVWMDPCEFAQLRAALYTVGVRRLLEWGSGGSTRAILAAFPGLVQHVSVEHDGAWHAVVKEQVTDPRLSLHHAPPDVPPPAGCSREEEIAWNARAEREPALMRSYVGLPRSLGGEPFDAVLVDGRARRLCIREGFELLRPGGILVLHDAQRTDYHDAVHAVGDPMFLTPFTQGQICLVRKPAP